MAMKRENFTVFRDPNHVDFDLNLVFIRADLPRLTGSTIFYRGKELDTFNGRGVIFWRDPSSKLASPRWNQVWFPVTTVPGVYWLVTRQPHAKGTGIVAAPQQVRGAYTLQGWGRKYLHLNQVEPFRVIRDFNYDEVVDLETGREENIIAGFEYHRASSRRITRRVGKYSAGCQVNPSPWSYDLTIRVFQSAIKAGWRNSFTATWLNESALSRD